MQFLKKRKESDCFRKLIVDFSNQFHFILTTAKSKFHHFTYKFFTPLLCKFTTQKSKPYLALSFFQKVQNIRRNNNEANVYESTNLNLNKIPIKCSDRNHIRHLTSFSPNFTFACIIELFKGSIDGFTTIS